MSLCLMRSSTHGSWTYTKTWHTFATDLYRATTDIRLVQKTLGHTDVSTMRLYTHLVDDAGAYAMRTLRHREPRSEAPAPLGAPGPW